MDDRKSSETEIYTGSDLESGPLLALEKEPDIGTVPLQQTTTTPSTTGKLVFWIALNILATIAIVFTNKLLLSDPLLARTQLLFAAYHFLLTHITLHICSNSRIGLFTRSPSPPLRSLLPVAIAMSLNVLLPNLSLAHSSITFYQTVRVLLTPCTAILNYLLYSRSLSRPAILALIPVCLGVAWLTYFDVRPSPSAQPDPSLPQGLFVYRPWSSTSSSPTPPSPTTSRTTSPLGALFALTGVLASSIYTLFISHFTLSLHQSPTQLLHRQSLLGGLLLLWLVPWIDALPPFAAVSSRQWLLIGVSGLCAVGINLSQFAIVAGAGPVGSTVVGHAKTVGVVGVGWGLGGGMGDGRAAWGVGVALGGIWGYSVVEGRERGRKGGAGR
ncbi:hypothetical protein BDZ85DRAFT_304299 [Elsinoe ampelina]|uniref:GDP-mannose transporter n=1 Tax=Elsinoe ampelina TaxID=302913 RepID=A0A6A6G1V9_9PEZI|nr:hypothetical protein BDZ85DRAFT_304299 [Elsinoe ampelina]